MPSRRRFAAGFAALAGLTGVLVFGGAIAAQADNGLEITTSTLAWSSGTSTLQGTADAGNQGLVEVREGTATDAPVLCTTPWAANWSCTVTLPAGTTQMTARQAFDGDLAWDAREDTTTVTVTYPDPNVTSANPLEVTAGSSVNVTGTTTYPNVTIQVTTSSPVGGCTVGAAMPTVGTPWSCSLPADPGVAGDFDLYVEQLVGGVAVGNAWVGTLSISAYPLRFTAPAPGADVDWTGNPTTLSGSSTDLVTPVSLFRSTSGSPDPIPGCQNLPVQPNGSWSCTAVFSPGEWDVYATQGSFTATAADFVVRIPAPSIQQSDPRWAPIDSVATFSGTTTYQGSPGSYVQVEFSDPGAFCTSEVAWDGEAQIGFWSCSIDIAAADPPFTDGATYTYTVLQEDEGALSRSASHTLVIGDEPPPALACAFVPSGVTITSTETVDTSVYRLTPFVEGEGSGSSGDGGYTLAPQGYCNGGSGYHHPTVTTWTDTSVQNCGTGECRLTALTPGIYEVYFARGESSDRFDYLFRVPETPTATGVVSTANSVVMRGNGTPGDAIRIVRPSGAQLCATEVTSTGRWACQFPKSSATSARAIAVDPQSGGLSAYSASRAIPAFVAPVTPAVDPPLTLVNWFLEFTSGDLMNLKPGDTFTLSISGMPEGTEIEVWMHSTPVLLGTETGTGLPMTMTLTVPPGIENGPHEIEMIGVTPLGTQYFFTSEARVTGGTDPAPPLKDEPVLDDKTDVGPYDRSDPASPSALSDGLAPVSAIVANPATLAIAGGLALALLFLVALPTELLNSSLSSNTSRLGRAYGTVDGALTKAQDWFIRVTRSRAVAALILTTIVAIIYGFVDPRFGFDLVSLRLVLSLALAFFVLSFVASWISGLIIRRAWGAIGVIEMQPTIILFAVVGVIVARILDFSPGFLVGIAIGLELLQATRTVSARAVFVQIAVVTGLALAAWGVYSVFTPGDDFAGMLLEDTMVALTAEGLTGALIALFPLKFLDGHDLWAVSKRLWLVAFLVVATAFALLVLPTAIAGTDVADYGIWLLVFAVFGLVSLAVWLIFVRADARAEASETERVDA